MPQAPQSRHAIDLAAPEFREMRREFSVDRSGIDKAARTVPLSFASEEGVERWFGREILEITPQACDLTRLKNGGSILMDHNWRDQVGVVLEASVDGATKKARCVAKFSRSIRGEEIFQDIQDGIRSLVSVGYVVRKMVLQSVDGDVETHRVTDWQPFEVSVVAVPADASVGVGRSSTHPEEPAARTAATHTRQRPTSMPPETITPPNAGNVTVTPETRATPPVVSGVNEVAAERQRMKDINAAVKVLCERFPKHVDAFRQLGSKCAETGDNADVLNRSALEILGTSPLTPTRQDGDAARLGLSEREIKRYSILRAINLILDNKPLDGFERECNDALAKKLERQPKGFFLPDEIIADRRALESVSRRTLLAGSPVDGGYTVGQDILSSEFVSLLRNQVKVVQLGARFITGLVGDVAIPRQLTGAVAYWVSETGSITASSATFGQIVGKPRRVGTSVPYTKQFLAQTSLDAESFVVNDSDEAIAVDLDRVAIRGTGGAEPLGILNLASGDRSTSVSFSAAPTWAKYLSFFGNVATANAIMGTPAYLTTPASAVKAMSIPKFTNGDEGIWTDLGKIGMFKADYSNQFPASGTIDQVIFGDFSQVIFLEWAGRDVVVDPYSGKKEGTVEITIQRLIDMVIRRGKSFAISSDSGAQ